MQSLLLANTAFSSVGLMNLFQARQRAFRDPLPMTRDSEFSNQSSAIPNSFFPELPQDLFSSMAIAIAPCVFL
jgi:hypothetical protein